MDTAEKGSQGHPHTHGGGLFTRMREAMGTVYGDIGTSVLYTLMEITRETVALKQHAHGQHLAALLEPGGDLITRGEALGGFSLVFWALIFLTIKYDLIMMRADNRGEGGTFALWALLKGASAKVFGITILGYLVVAAAGLLAADGVITPPISMLGAYEPLGEHWAVAATLVSLFVLFKPQWRGTSQVGGLFGWFMMLVWFPWIALKGLPWIFRNPEVFLAVNPMYAVRFLTSFPQIGLFVILGVVVLAITGGEAKYADIGHFARRGETEVHDGQSINPADSGRRPVMFSWFYLVLPCLLLNYAGQVGYLLERGVPPRANTFYALTPRTGDPSVDRIILAVDMVISAIAAFIAAQALITGMFSIVKQAIALGFCPRFEVKFTSREAEGQVYIPAINWAMFLGCVTITLVFRTSGNLAAAYGIAVTGTMGITTLAFGYVAHYRWGWQLWKVLIVCTPIIAVDLLFFVSNLLKFMHGGYYPVAIAAALVSIMLTWQWGRGELAKAFYAFGVEGGKKISWLVALREKVDEIQLSIDENLPLARTLVQGSAGSSRLIVPSSSSAHVRSATSTSMCRCRCESSSKNSACSRPTSRSSTSNSSRWPRPTWGIAGSRSSTSVATSSPWSGLTATWSSRISVGRSANSRPTERSTSPQIAGSSRPARKTSSPTMTFPSTGGYGSPFSGASSASPPQRTNSSAWATTPPSRRKSSRSSSAETV